MTNAWAPTAAELRREIARHERATTPSEQAEHQFPPLEDRSTAVLSPQGGIEYVDDLVKPGRLTLVAGEESSGKSTAIREMGIRLACAGGEWAGTWKVLRTVPVAIGSEMHPDDDYAGEETTLASLGKTRADLAGNYFRFSLYDTAAGQPPLMVPAWRAYISSEVARLGIGVLIFDTGTTATNVDPWGEKMQEVIAALKGLMTENPTLAIIVLVHLKKPQGRGQRRISDVLGEWGRFVDVVILIDNDGASLTRVRISARKRVRHERTIIATKAGGLLIDPQELGDGPTPKVSPEAVVAAVVRRPGMTASQLAAELDVSRATAQEYARAAEQAGKIERREGGPRGALLLFAVSDRPEVSGEHDWTDAGQTVDGGTGEPSDRPTDLYRSDGSWSDGQAIPNESEEELLEQLRLEPRP